MNNTTTLSKKNYKIIVLGCAVVVLGFILMMGGGSDDPNIFNEQELFSFRRITLAPFLIILGYMVVLFGVMKRNKVTALKEENTSKKGNNQEN